MADRQKPDREQQIAFMMSAPERLTNCARAWLTDPQVKAALHQYDDDNASGYPQVKRAVR